MSSATLVLALPGAGKTSLLALLLQLAYIEHGRELQYKSCKLICELNRECAIAPYELPLQPPIYTDITSFKVKFKVGYNKWFEPYGLNPYYLGVNDERRDTQFVFPYSQIFIPEIQKYADSRKGQTFPKSLSRVFEIRRHFHLDIYMDGHKGNFVDLKIRAMCDRVIDLLKQEHEYDELGRIVKTTWYCREFKSYEAYEAYNSGGEVESVETTYIHEGNIFDYYDSFGCQDEFLPPRNKGAQFSNLKALPSQKIGRLPKEIAKYYSYSEPKEFRGK